MFPETVHGASYIYIYINKEEKKCILTSKVWEGMKYVIWK